MKNKYSTSFYVFAFVGFFISFSLMGQTQITAVNDYGTVANGSTTTVVIGDVLGNDSINGLPITISDVTLSQVSATSNFLSLNENTGALSFVNGPAPVGTYSLQYQICSLNSPVICSNAFVYISIGCNVTAPVIGSINQPSCVSSTGSVSFSGLPTTGNWNLYSNNSFIAFGTGPTYTLPNLAPGNYSFYVRNSLGCDSPPVTLNVGFIQAGLNGFYDDFNNDGITNVGDVISYQCIIANSGNCAATNVVVTSSGLNVVGTPIPTLAIGDTDSTSFNALYLLTQNDINAGFVQKTSLTTATIGSGTTNVTSTSTTFLDITDAIKLVAFVDTNSNGVKDGLEQNFTLGTFNYELIGSGIVHNITSNGPFYLYESNPTNVYNISYTVFSDYAFQYTVSPAAYNNITIAANSGVTTYNFPITVIPYKDLQVYVTPYSAPPRPGFTYYNQVIYRNNGNTPITSGTVTFNKDNLVSVLSVTQAGTVPNATGFTYTFSNLQPNESRNFLVDMQVPTIPTISLGTQLTNTASITIPVGDINVNNNTSSLTQIIVGSYDPNDKAESHGSQVLFSSFTANDYLTYTIRFENTGTANAVNVKVNDILDIKLDETSVRTINSSHPYILERINNNLTWKFNAIELPPSVPGDEITGHGFFVFQVKPKPGFALGDIIPNTADIFFDFNPAIVTNTWTTEFVPLLGVNAFDSDTFEYYPNPTSDVVTFSLKNTSTTIDRIEVMDILGKTLLTKTIKFTQANIDLSSLANGIYLVKISANGQDKTVKISKE
jgi:uncharacterized repeat protein (TIGR01451 family)